MPSNVDPTSPSSLDAAGKPPSNEGPWPLQNLTGVHVFATNQNSRLPAHMMVKEFTCIHNPEFVAVRSQPIHERNPQTDPSVEHLGCVCSDNLDEGLLRLGKHALTTRVVSTVELVYA